MDNKIVTLDAIRLDRQKPRNCTCGDTKRFTVDKVNREITCGCGLVVDPFEAMLYLSQHYDYINKQHEAMDQQRREWMKQKPHSVIFKRLEQSYQRGKMLPTCPRCEQVFDYSEINGHVNADFYRKWKSKQTNS